MKALTLTQPWASLVACGAQRIETRSWRTDYRGPLAIHAAAGLGGVGGVGGLSIQYFTWGFHDVLRDRLGYEGPDDLPRGVIVAFVDLVDVDTTWDVGRRLPRRPQYPMPGEPVEQAYGNYGPGRWAWVLRNVRALPHPIPCKGALGLWTVPDDVADEITAALAYRAIFAEVAG